VADDNANEKQSIIMNIKDQIRAEIERRMKRENEILWNAKKRGTYPSPSCEYNLLTLTSLRDFLDSLPEQVNGPSRDQVGTKFAVEGLEEAADKYSFKYSDFDTEDGGYNVYDHEKREAFIAGAEWQKDKMMEDAVEGEIQMRYSGCLCAKTIRAINEDKFKLGDKVRVIVIKEDER
jgi:hypothetical protein